MHTVMATDVEDGVEDGYKSSMIGSLSRKRGPGGGDIRNSTL